MIQAIFCDFYGTLVPEYGPASYEVIWRVCESGSEKNPKAVVAAWWKRYGEKQQAAWGDTFRTQYELALESYQELLEEGNRDGSLHTEYAKELAELMPLLTSLWLLPSVFPADKEGMKHKFHLLGDMLEKMGVPLMDDSIYELVEQFFEKMPDES